MYPKVLIDKQTISGRFHRKLAPVTVEKGCPGDWGEGRRETLTFVPRECFPHVPVLDEFFFKADVGYQWQEQQVTPALQARLRGDARAGAGVEGSCSGRRCRAGSRRGSR